MRKSDAALIEQAKCFNTRPYSVSTGALLEVARMYDNNICEGFSTIYAMGFIKGQRSARNKRRATK